MRGPWARPDSGRAPLLSGLRLKNNLDPSRWSLASFSHARFTPLVAGLDADTEMRSQGGALHLDVGQNGKNAVL
jgi:hypothetical protein